MARTSSSRKLENVRDEGFVLFESRFWRSHRLLHLIACRILDDQEKAKSAVQNCWRSASVRAPQFEYEGAFRSWLVRILIDEALLLRESGQLRETASRGKARRLRTLVRVAERNV
jgi:DNA-directed RNA polymerase specialized sigma24 family protein